MVQTRSLPAFQNTLAALAAAFLLGIGTLALAGCGGSSAESGQGSSAAGGQESIHLVYVNWVEGMAMAHVMKALLQDRLGMDVRMSGVSGGGAAFSAVASGSADVFVEAWLPTTHGSAWERYKDQLVKIGHWYDSTSVGLVVPAYTDIESVEDLADFREELEGQINGIESGAAINDQTRKILKNNGIEGFNVVAASGAATWSALQRAIEQKEPIVVTGWKPHWKWGRFDLRYLQGAQTGQSPVFGAPETIFVLAQQGFEENFPDRVVQFFQSVSINDQQLESLMQPFRPRSGVSDKMEAARAWITNHREVVSRWLPDGKAQHAKAAEATAGPPS